ncbi:MAG TPA: HAD family hydrolase [Candidatus Atribacteria bacterium]|nr:HAD family hydrolase [Candidatus Atribacteria bacterium]HPU08137.1 HAD family hydrolase [Candidatus Atribacteria bacterium]
MFKLFIWDLDNTLIASSPLLWGAFSWVAEKYGNKKMTPPEIVRFYGPPEDVVIEKIVGKDKKEEALREFYRFYEKKHDELVGVFPLLLKIINCLRGWGVKQAIFTSKGRKSAEITLQKLNIQDLFDLVVCGDEIARSKPYPDGVIKILETLVVEPQKTLYLGDSPLDAEAAHRAGVCFALTLWDSLPREEKEEKEVEWVFHSPEELWEWVQKIYN